jgi:hypothetical protein
MGALKPSAIFPHTQGLAALRLGAPAQGPHWGLGPCRHPLASLRVLSDIFKDGTAMSMLVKSLAPWLPGEGCHGLDHSADHDDGGSRQQAAGSRGPTSIHWPHAGYTLCCDRAISHPDAQGGVISAAGHRPGYGELRSSAERCHRRCCVAICGCNAAASPRPITSLPALRARPHVNVSINLTITRGVPDRRYRSQSCRRAPAGPRPRQSGTAAAADRDRFPSHLHPRQARR